jgi:hypothetical protein
VERHGHEDVRVPRQLGPGPRHGRAERPGELDPVAVLEPVDQGLGRVVVAGDGPRPIEDRRVGDGGGERSGIPRSTAKGVPSRSQKGRSISDSLLQQRAQSPCGSAVAPPQPMQVGG